MSVSPSDSHQVQSAGGGWYRQVQGLHVLKLKGSFYEMGRQHGELLKDVIPHGSLPYYGHYVDRILGPGLLKRVAWAILKRTVGRRVAAGLMPETEAGLRGMADGAGMMA